MTPRELRTPGPESATVTSLRQRNRATALTFILRSRETTRADVARQCGLSTASAANIVADLIEEGLVAEIGTVASRGGRPIAIIAPRADGAYSLGADVGERGVAVELFDLGLNMVDREFRGGRVEETVDGIETDIVEAVSALRERNAERWGRVLGIGLGLPGVVETEGDGSQVLFAQSLGWEPYQIPPVLPDGLTVFADNGAKSLARAELWFGSARGVDRAAVALLGRGVGLGVIADGTVARGAFSSATEWGHTKIRFGGQPCRCGNRGCVEAYIGADAILGAWRRAGGVFEGSGWQALGAFLEDAAAGGTAHSVLDDTIEALGAALGNIVNLTSPQRIVVGGWVGMRLMEHHTPQILDAIRRNSLARAAEQFDLVSASFGGDTIALGSAVMPIESCLIDDRTGRI
ncbi:ROK family transcriptional regulator [Microbacterium sp. SS28]|uniref:ROK family transcriptional regulator n=1 Tax=Microbacterium sp. SS28 TaxID=2919948 RepID=UPI001FAAE1E5|nr:ROK family transcriptional regulator [Microbacterium sp. SS28]